MRRVEILTPEGRVAVYATNTNDGGIFFRKPHDGVYQQVTGNMQTPHFKDKTQFRRYLRRHHGVRGREVAAFGW